MARFKASRFLKSTRVAKTADPKAEATDEADHKAAPAMETPPAARMAEPMKARPAVQPQESHVDTSRRVDPGQTMRRVDSSTTPTATSHEPPPVQRVTSAEDLSRPAPDTPISRRGSNLVDEKADSSATTVDDERGSAERMDPGSLGDADGGQSEGLMGKPIEDYIEDDFGSRSSSEGFGSFDDSAEENSPAGTDHIPTGTLGESVGSSLAADETTLVDPADMTNDGPEMPAGFDRSPGNMKTADLRGVAGDADAVGGDSMASLGGFAEEDPDAATADTSQDDTTSSDSSTQTEDDYGQREYLKGNSDGAGQSLDTDNMSDQDVADAVATEADYETAIRPGKEYLEARDYDTDKMSNEEIVDALDKEAAYEISGGQDGTTTSPSYIDADSGGEDSAQVAADAAKLHIPTAPVQGNIDPTEFGNGAEEAADKSILGMSDPVNSDDSTSFGGGSIGAPPPRAGVDFGPDHVGENPGGGLSDNMGGVGIGHDDGTINVDLGTDDGAVDSDAGGLLDELSQLDDPSHLADTPDIGFAVDPDDMAADDPIDIPADDLHHIDRVDDIFE